MAIPVITVTCFYSCHECALREISVKVPARESEDVVKWVEATLLMIGTDHASRSPHCPGEKADVKIPIGGTAGDRVGGATVQ